MFRTKQSLQLVLKRIDEAEDDEIMEIIKSLVHWQNARYSEYEMVVISLPKFDMEKRFQQIDIMADYLKNIQIQE